MKFKLQAVNANDITIEGNYKIEAGVLSIVPDQGNPLVISPAGWISVEVLEAPERGGTASV
jgi:hypothetical protein